MVFWRGYTFPGQDDIIMDRIVLPWYPGVWKGYTFPGHDDIIMDMIVLPWYSGEDILFLDRMTRPPQSKSVPGILRGDTMCLPL